MARPRDICFFEKTLSQPLPEAQQWLIRYDENSQILVNYIDEHGAGSTAHYAAIRCLTMLREHLIKSGESYSAELAMKWFQTTGPYPKGYLATLYRLADLFAYGAITPLNAFPRALPYSQCLQEIWSAALHGFLEECNQSEKSREQAKNCVSRFLYHIQQNGILHPSDITFETLEEYFKVDEHRSANGKARYTYAVGDILLYMADKGMCNHGLGWYPYFMMHGRVFRFCDLSDIQKNAIEDLRTESQDFPAEEYAVLIPAFLKRFAAYGYSKTPYKVARYTLYNLLLFIEMHGLGYHQGIADIWLDHEKTFHKGLSWKQSRRVLFLFHLYTQEGDVIPQFIHRIRPLLCETLPEWCQQELLGYIALKEKERWEKSTINMIRSSITRFCSFLSGIGIEAFKELTAKDLKEFNFWDKHSTAEGKNAYNGRIRKFIQYLERKGTVPYGLHLALLCTAASSEKIIITLTQEEKEAIKEKQSCSRSFMELRDKAIILLGTKMGLRASDIVTIMLADIDWDQQTIKVIQEKTGHEILLPMPVDVGNAIYLYIKEGRSVKPAVGSYLFIKSRTPYDSLRKDACAKALKRTLPDRSVPGSGFHVTRKTYATDRLAGGTGKQGLIDLLGQRDTQSLRHYLQMDEKRMRMCPISLAETGLQMKGGRYDSV